MSKKKFKGICQIEYIALADSPEEAKTMIENLIQFHCKRGIEILPDQWDRVKLVSVSEIKEDKEEAKE
jgi:hypothetical protein